MADFQHCYHHRALMLTFLTTTMIVLEPPIREMIPGVQWSTGQSNIIDILCTQWQNATEMAHFHHCYHHRALRLTFITTIMLVPEPPIRGMIPGVQWSTEQRHIIGDELTQWPNAPEMAHFHHCYHHRALMLTFLTTIIIVPEPPIRGMILGVQWWTGQGNIMDAKCTQ